MAIERPLGLDGAVSRTRDRNVAIAIIAVVAVGIAVMIAVSVLEGDPEPSDRVRRPALDVPAAVVHETFDDACDAFAEGGIKGKRAKAPAEADKDELVERLPDRRHRPRRGHRSHRLRPRLGDRRRRPELPRAWCRPSDPGARR